MQPSSIPVGSFDQLARSAGGLQPAAGSNVAAPTLPAHVDNSQISPTHSVAAGFAELAAAAGANTPVPTPSPSRLPEVSQPDSSQRSYPPVDVSTTISGK